MATKIEPKAIIEKDEQRPGQYGYILEQLKDKTIECIGLLRLKTDEGDDLFRNVVFTVHDGKIVYGVLRDPTGTEGDAINDATAWLDGTYYV